MLHIICGSSGAGKTKYLTELIRRDIENKKKCYLLVPEQQAYISERDLPPLLPKNAGLYFEIIHFSGLAEHVFRRYGGLTAPSINPGLRSLLMWDTVRKLSPILLQYGTAAGRDAATLSGMMLRAINELRTNGIDGLRLSQVAEEMSEDTPLKRKLSDLAAVDTLYHERIIECFGSDPSERLLRLAETLSQHAYFQGAHFYIDSFTSFTANEYAVLKEIMKQADGMTVSLCFDHFGTHLPHFESITESAKRLSRLASNLDLEVKKTELFSKSTEKPHALSILERDLWRFELRREEREKTDDVHSVTLYSTSNIYEECDTAALHILHLIQSGMRFGDIAIVARDAETYRGVLDVALKKYGIPYFFSERTDFSAKPLSRLILSALRAVSRHDQADDVMTLVKTGLCGVDRREVSLFEEFCTTWHISGKRFHDATWSMNPDGLTTEWSDRSRDILRAANHVRKTVMEPLEELAAELAGSDKLKDRCAALYHYLCRLNISDLLSARARRELTAGQKREASETLRLYTFLTDSLTLLCRVMPDERLTVDEFYTALRLLFSATDLGSVPPVNDCVILGSASTLRLENVKAMFLLGLCEGEFPRALSDDGLLTEADKIALEEYDLRIDSHESKRSSEELFYVYRAMTKPSEALILSTVKAQPDGSMRTPSLAFTRACFLLDRAPISPNLSEIRNETEHREESSDRFYLSPLPAGTQLRLSQSKIHTFLLCPYSYYSTHRLHLRGQKDSALSYADDGTFLHYVFEHFLRACLGEDRSLSLPTDEELKARADQIILDYLRRVYPVSPEEMDNRLFHTFSRLRTLCLRMLLDIVEELRASLYVPHRFEQVIGMAGENGLPPIKLSLANGSTVLLTGKIDRIDLYRKGEEVYIRVVDYKAGQHDFSVQDVQSGLDIQLILYLFGALSSSSDYRAGGAEFVYPQRTGIVRSGLLLGTDGMPEIMDTTSDKKFSSNRLKKTEEEISTLIQDMNRAVEEVASRILAGEAQKTPSEEACRYCAVRANCDKAILKKE